MHKFNIFLSVSLLLLLNTAARPQHTFTVPSAPSSHPVLTAKLQSALASLPPGGRLTVIVSLRDQADLAQLENGIVPLSTTARRTLVVERLKNQASTTQKNILSKIQSWIDTGEVDRVTPLWIFNGVSLRATAAVIRELAKHPDVVEISPELTMHAPATPDLTTLTGTNLEKIGVSQLWQKGIYGEGIVIGSLDTGVDYTHPDLKNQWRGGTNSWFDPFGEHPDTPSDGVGHGTWTMGVMVGGASNGTPIGVAPKAKWISAKVFDDTGLATETAIHLSFQWILDPDGDPKTDDAPDVVNNSWGFDMSGCLTNMQKDLQALRAAGILPIFSAGNSGPDPNTSVSPANNPEAFSVGATNSSDLIHDSSSRGPSSCDPEAVYPTIVAPGEDIYTTGLSGEYSSHSGTSLSAPHVAGSLALLLNVAPDLSVKQQAKILIDTAMDLGAPGPDNDFGYGRIDVWKAFQSLELNPNPPKPVLYYLPSLFRCLDNNC